MGLDIVELIYSFERYFNVEVPDAVAESIYTVGDVAEWLSQQLGVAGQRQSAARAAQITSELPPHPAPLKPHRYTRYFPMLGTSKPAGMPCGNVMA